MSNPASSRIALRIVATLACTASLAACGFKGPLYLPTPGDAAQRTPRVIAPFEFRAAPGVHTSIAYPDYPSPATSQ